MRRSAASRARSIRRYMSVPQQISEDLAQLARITACVRTYSVDNGLDQVPALAAKAGLKVIHGIWLGSDRLKNRQQIDTDGRACQGISRRHLIHRRRQRGVVARRDDRDRSRRAHPAVKAQVDRIPVTYADVWEFWLQHREIYEAVDFITIHILPYWEDFPIRARHAAAHVDSIRKRVAVAFPAQGDPDRRDRLAERGPHARGRAALAHQPGTGGLGSARARQREKYNVNLIEAYDQPWKRALEGTVGGYWGLFDGVSAY